MEECQELGDLLFCTYKFQKMQMSHKAKDFVLRVCVRACVRVWARAYVCV